MQHINDGFTWRSTLISQNILLNIKTKLSGINAVEKNKIPLCVLRTFFFSLWVLMIMKLHVAELVILQARLSVTLLLHLYCYRWDMYSLVLLQVRYVWACIIQNKFLNVFWFARHTFPHIVKYKELTTDSVACKGM